MKNKFTKTWNKSKQPRKQRKYNANAPSHLRGKFLNVRLNDELSKKYSKRNLRVRRDDQVKVLRGKFKGKTGKVEEVNTKTSKVHIAGVEAIKKDGSKTRVSIHASNLMLVSIFTDDKKRMKKLESKGAK